MNADERERLEVELLLEAVSRCSGYDFRAYSRASIERRTRQFTADRNLESISELIPRVLRDDALLAELIRTFSIAVTEMFRDPLVYRALRQQVVPVLKTYPFVRVWHAGCATGEEVYSVAILLEEEGLGERATFFGTDINDQALETARRGIYPAERIRTFSRNYQEAGGRASFSEYYHARYDAAVLDARFRSRITFANHNLATDAVFGEAHLLLCRNVLIYFDRELQDRALRLLDESLVRGGFLCLGSQEDLRFSELSGRYEVVDEAARLYRKKGPA